MRCYFVTSNSYKVSEYTRIFSGRDINLDHFNYEIDEIQTIDEDAIIKDKAQKAYARVRRGIIVEHASLSLEALNGLPKGFSKPFWDLLANHICDIAKHLPNKKVQMTVNLAYCDGKRIYPVTETVEGELSDKAQPGAFNLDRIFIPSPKKICLSQMTDDQRDDSSPRLKSVTKLCNIIHGLSS